MKLTPINPHFNACDQKWELMPEQDGGRLCESCERVLIDFTQTTEQEVLNLQRANDFNLCGRYTRSQVDRLHRHLTLEESQSNRPWLVSLAMGFGSMLPMGVAAQDNLTVDSVSTTTSGKYLKGLAQEVVTLETLAPSSITIPDSILFKKQVHSSDENNITTELLKIPTALTVPMPSAPGNIQYPLLDVTNATNEFIELKGTVKEDETGEPLPFASVWVEGTNTGTSTDFDGNFSLKVPISYGKVMLVTSYIGYAQDSILVDLALAKDTMEMPIIELIAEPMQLYIVGGPFFKPTIGQKLKRWSNPANWYRRIRYRIHNR